MSWINKRSNRRYYFLLSVLLILIAINPWTIVKLDPNPPLSNQVLVRILIFDFLIFLFGSIFAFLDLNIIKRFMMPALVVVVSTLIPFLALEILLRSTSWLDQVDSPNPSYIPEYLREYDKKIEMIGYITEEGFRVTDDIENLILKLKQDRGCKVVILGDSFVWGAGLLPEKRWPNKLAKLVDCKIYPFGKNGWSTIEQFGFYDQYLSSLEFDYLLIGVVENDPHPRGKFLDYQYDPEIYIRTNWGILESLGLNAFHVFISDISYSYDFTSQLFKAIVTPLVRTRGSLSDPPIISAGYASWRERLYQEDVYSLWEDVLFDFSKVSNHSYGFILTPTAGIESERKLWIKVDKTIKSLGVPYINLYDETVEVFGGEIRPREAWANRADAHPGDLQTSVYARGATEVLTQLGFENK